MAARAAKSDSRRSARRRAAVLVLIVLAAFGLRAAFGLARRDGLYRFGDSQGYRKLGVGLAERGRLEMTDCPVGPAVRRADRMPGYPLVLAGLRRLFGEDEISLIMLQSAVGAAAAWLAWLLGREVFSPLAGLLAAAAVALAPWQIYFASVALTECWSAALLPAVVLCAVKAVKQRQRRWAFTAGLACAGLVYFHPGFLGLPVAMLILAVAAPGRRQWILYWSLAMSTFVAGMGPWQLRNVGVFGRAVPTTTRLGVTLYDGLRPGADGSSDMSFEEADARAGETRGLSELAYDGHYRGKSWQAVCSDPPRVLRLAAAKFRRLWSPVPNAEEGRAVTYRWASILAYVPMVAGALLATVVLLRRPAVLLLLLVPVVWVTMVHLVMVGSVRYRVPIEPLLWVMAAASVAWVVQGETGTDER